MAAAKRKFIQGDMSLNRPTLEISALSDLARANPETFMRRVEDLIAAKKFGLRSVPDLKALFNAFVDIPVKTAVDMGTGKRAVTDTSAFTLLMGSLVVDEINRAYDENPTIGEKLVRDMESNKKFAHVVKIVNQVGQEVRTKEGEEFPMISASEQFSVIGTNRKGFQLAISQETLDENDMGSFLSLVDQGGQFASELIEEQTLSRVFDQNGSAGTPIQPYVWIPNGVPTQLFNSTANLPGTQAPLGTRILNNPLTSTVNLTNARKRLNSMLNTRLRRIATPMSKCKLLVPDALLETALKILDSNLEPGVFNEMNNWGPQGRFRPEIISSPKIDDITTVDWMLGDFEQQFRRKWKIRLETVSVYSDPMTYARTREAYRTRVCWDVEVGAIDYVFAVQCLGGATPGFTANVTGL